MMRLRVTDHEPTANRSVDAPQATDCNAFFAADVFWELTGRQN